MFSITLYTYYFLLIAFCWHIILMPSAHALSNISDCEFLVLCGFLFVYGIFFVLAVYGKKNMCILRTIMENRKAERIGVILLLVLLGTYFCIGIIWDTRIIFPIDFMVIAYTCIFPLLVCTLVYLFYENKKILVLLLLGMAFIPTGISMLFLVMWTYSKKISLLWGVIFVLGTFLHVSLSMLCLFKTFE